MEPLRDPQFQLGHNVMISEVFAIIMCVGGFLLAVILIGWNKYKHGSFFGSKDGEPLAILPVYHTKEGLKKQEEQQKLTEARIRQAGGDIPAEAPAEAAVPAAPKEKKPLSARWKEWWAAFPDRAREFFRPYSAEQGGADGGEDPAAGESKFDPAADGNAPADGETPADAPAEEGASAGNGAEGNGAERSGKDGGEV